MVKEFLKKGGEFSVEKANMDEYKIRLIILDILDDTITTILESLKDLQPPKSAIEASLEAALAIVKSKALDLADYE